MRSNECPSIVIIIIIIIIILMPTSTKPVGVNIKEKC